VLSLSRSYATKMRWPLSSRHSSAFGSSGIGTAVAFMPYASWASVAKSFAENISPCLENDLSRAIASSCSISASSSGKHRALVILCYYFRTTAESLFWLQPTLAPNQTQGHQTASASQSIEQTKKKKRWPRRTHVGPSCNRVGRGVY